MRTTIVQAGRLQAAGGALSLSYSPERGWVQLYASDPEDKRKTGIFIGLTLEQYEQLKRIFAELDQVILEESKIAMSSNRLKVRQVLGTEQFAVATSAGTVHIPAPIVELAKHIASTQSEDKAQEFLAASLAGLSPLGSSEVLSALLSHWPASRHASREA